MKGVLKIKILKKYIPIVFTAFAFLFVNINDVNAHNKGKELGSYYIVESNDILEINENILSHSDLFVSRLSLSKSTEEYNYLYIRGDFNQFIPQSDSATEYIYSDNINSGIVIDINGNVFTNPNGGVGRFFYLSDKATIDEPKKNVYEVIYFNNLPDNAVLIEPPKEIYTENINNLNFDINNNEITFNYDLPTDNNFSHLELHQDGSLLLDNIISNQVKITDLSYDTKFQFTFYAVDKDGNKSTGVSREIALPSDPNLIPSNNIFGLTHSVSDTTVSFNYSLPLDNNFSHLKIYRNNELISDNYQLSEYIDTGLEPETEYNYRFVSVNKMDISNVGYAITIKTMEENDDVPPAVPTGLNVTNMNSGIVLSWNTNTESDLKGYNVYMNGIKLNSKPITNTVYNITNLENGLDYSFNISAVDNFDNESEQSSNVVGVPDVDNLPIFKLDTKLSSIGSSVENWFSEIWLIVAFATAIPLSFAIAGRVKGLFIA